MMQKMYLEIARLSHHDLLCCTLASSAEDTVAQKHSRLRGFTLVVSERRSGFVCLVCTRNPFPFVLHIGSSKVVLTMSGNIVAL